MTTKSFVSFGVTNIIAGNGRSGRWGTPFSFKDNLEEGDVGLLIFSDGQEKEFEFFITNWHGTYVVLPKAVNCNSGHGRDPRNTLVVFWHGKGS